MIRKRNLQLAVYVYILIVPLILSQVGPVFAASSTYGPPYRDYHSNPSSGTCQNGLGPNWATKTCAYNNLQYGYNFLYADGSSYCDPHGSCPSIHPEANGNFNSNEAGQCPYGSTCPAHLWVPGGTYQLFLGQNVVGYGHLHSELYSYAYARADWIVTLCTIKPGNYLCTNDWTRIYSYTFDSALNGVDKVVNKVYYFNGVITWPTQGYYSLYGGEASHVDVSPYPGYSAYGAADFYTNAYSFEPTSIGLSY
jgi:hypothetical protein